jgi:hypothetical protein
LPERDPPDALIPEEVCPLRLDELLPLRARSLSLP